MKKTSGLIVAADINYLYEAIPKTEIVTKFGLDKMAVAINDLVFRATVNRLFDDGLGLSDRIWRVGIDYKTQISRVISAGFAQGRDPAKIARDIRGYIKEGKEYLAKSYGPKLKQGTREFFSRIRKSVDYRALRLVRSELYMSLQDAALLSGKANPGTKNLESTPSNGVALLRPFIFNEEQRFALELSDAKMRLYFEDGLVTLVGATATIGTWSDQSTTIPSGGGSPPDGGTGDIDIDIDIGGIISGVYA